MGSLKMFALTQMRQKKREKIHRKKWKTAYKIVHFNPLYIQNNHIK